MSSTKEMKDAVRLAQQYNVGFYRFLINGLVDSSLTRSQFKVELENYTRSRMKVYDCLYQIRDSNIPDVRVKEEQINVLQEQVKRNDKLKLEVHKIQRSLWDARAKGQQIPMANRDVIVQGFPELCVSTNPSEVPLTVLCEKLIHKYNIRKEPSIKDLLRWAKEESISRQRSNMVTSVPCQDKPSVVQPVTVNIKPAEPITEAYNVTPVMSWEDASVQLEANMPVKEPEQPVTFPPLEQEENRRCLGPRKYPIFSWEELSEMFLKQRIRNNIEKPEEGNDTVKSENKSVAAKSEAKIAASKQERKSASTKQTWTMKPETKVAAPKPKNKSASVKPAWSYALKPNKKVAASKPENRSTSVKPAWTLKPETKSAASKPAWKLKPETKSAALKPENKSASGKPAWTLKPETKSAALKPETKNASGKQAWTLKPETKMSASTTMTNNLQPFVGSHHPHVYEKKIKRSQHASKTPTGTFTSAKSLEYQQKRAALMTALELKRQRLKDALTQQYNKSKSGKSVHYYKTQNPPKVEKTHKTSAPNVQPKYQAPTSIGSQGPVVGKKCLLPLEGQISRKRSASSDSPAPAAKRARSNLVLKIFREESNWNIKQVTGRD